MSQMKKRNHGFRKIVYLAFIMIFLFAAGTQAAPKISAKKLTLPVGGKQNIKITGKSKKQKVKWKSSKKKVAAVSSKGVVNWKKAGKAKITATVGKKKFTCTVKVVAMKMNTPVIRMETGSTYPLKVSGASAGKIRWSSSSSSVASVTGTGLVRGNSAGDCVITASLYGKQFTCSVTITSSVKMNVNAVTVVKGSNYQLSVSGSYGGAAWSSSDSNVVKVSSTGRLTGVKAGSATVTAYTGGKKLSCAVTVKSAATETVIKRTTKTVTTTTPVKGTTSREVTTVTQPSSDSGKGTGTSQSSTGRVTYAPGSRENQVYKILMGFKSRYPEGMNFTNADYRSWVGGIYRGGFGCAGFCFELSDAAFAPNLAVMRTTNLTKGLRPGDIIRLDYNTHSVIITEVYSDAVVVAEANFNSSVHWGRRITFDEIARTGTNIITRYEESSAAQIKAVMDMYDELPVLGEKENRVKH